MIDEAATFEKFGYYSTDWAPQSNKRIIAVCDECGRVREVYKHAYRALGPSCSRNGDKCLVATRKKLSESHRGEKNHNYGKHHSEATRKKMSEARRGEKHPLYGKHHSEVACKKIGDAERGEKNHNYGKPLSEATKKKISEAHAGKKLSEAHKKKIGDAERGAKNPQWKGGISNKYCSKWNNQFREYIRNKYNRKCFLCSKTEEENGRRLVIHHVNLNKNCGCDEDTTCQFVPLCMSCHGKVHTISFDWEKHITEKQCCDLRGWYI